jgi:hypothetical protein
MFKRFLLLALLATSAFAAEPRPDAVAGVYKHRFHNAAIAGPGKPDEPYESEDVVEVVPVDASAVYLRAELQFYNGHVCSVAGVAKWNGDRYFYRASGEGENCFVTLRQDGKDLVLDNRLADGTQSEHCLCGARGSFYDYRLPMSSRRTIRYMARLKASHEYHDAIEEYVRASAR